MTDALAYLRVSGKGQIGGDGFPRQRDVIGRYATAHNIEAVGEYLDAGVSGTKDLDDRQGLSDLLDRVRSNGVIASKIPRRPARHLTAQQLVSYAARIRRNEVMMRQAITLPLLLGLVVHPALAALDVSGTYTATVGTASLALMLVQSAATPLPGQPGPSVTGTMAATGTPCFTSLAFAGALTGTVLNGAFTDAASRIDVQLTVSGNQLAGTYSISAGPCGGRGGQITFARTAPAATPTPTVGSQTLPVSGTISYLGAQGPVSATRPIEVLLFNEPIGFGGNKPVATATVAASPGNFTLQVPAGTYYLVYYVDFTPLSAPQVGEPYQIYNHQLTPPGDVLVVSGSGVTGLNLAFDDSGILSGVAGTVTYTGALGSVSHNSRLIVERFSSPTVAGPALGQTTVQSNGGGYDLITLDAGIWYLVAYLDLNNSRVRDPGEPFTIYNHKGAPPADPVQASTTQTAVDITFGDENVAAGTPTPVMPTATAPLAPSATRTPTPTASASPMAVACTGDCNGDGMVVINELIRLVNFALGASTDCSTCPDGIPAGVSCPSGVTIAVSIQGVNHALNGCGG